MTFRMKTLVIFMAKYFLLVFFVLSGPLCAFGQVGSLRTEIFSDESVKRNVAAQTAADNRRAQAAAEQVERERRAMRQIETDFAADRERELERLKNLPADTSDRQQQLDYFRCMYPLSATRPPSAGDVDNCVRQLTAERDNRVRLAALEQERLERERLREEQAKKEEERRKVELEARLAAEEQKRAEEKKAAQRDVLLGLGATVLGLIGLFVTIYKRRGYGWGSVSLAVLFGGLSGFSIYFLGAMLIIKGGPPSTLFVAVTFFGGWIFTINLLLKGTISISKVISRGFLLGAVEWLVTLPVSFFVVGMVATSVSNTGGSNAATAGAAIGGGIIAFLSGWVATGMVIFCLIGYAVTYFFTREMRPEASDQRKKCPECAELIQLEARKCRYCGTEFVQSGVAST